MCQSLMKIGLQMKHGHKQINNLVHFSTNIHNDTRKLNINGIFTICMIDKVIILFATFLRNENVIRQFLKHIFQKSSVPSLPSD